MCYFKKNDFFFIFQPKNLVVSEKSSTFAAANEKLEAIGI